MRARATSVIVHPDGSLTTPAAAIAAKTTPPEPHGPRCLLCGAPTPVDGAVPCDACWGRCWVPGRPFRTTCA